MPRGHKIDAIETARLRFKNHRSFVSSDGRLFLRGEDWLQMCWAVLIRDERRCFDCRKLIDLEYESLGRDFDVHHIIKRSDGGSDDLYNLCLLCRGCHTARHPEKQTQWSAT